MEPDRAGGGSRTKSIRTAGRAALARRTSTQRESSSPTPAKTTEAILGGCRVHSGDRPPPHPRPARGGETVTLVTCQLRDAVGNTLPCLTSRLPYLGTLSSAARHSQECAVTL